MEYETCAAAQPSEPMGAHELRTVANLLTSLNNYHRGAVEKLRVKNDSFLSHGKRSHGYAVISAFIIFLCVLHHLHAHLLQLALACCALLYAHSLSLVAADAHERSFQSLRSRVNQIDTLVAQLRHEADQPELDPAVSVDLARALRTGSLVVSATRATLNAFPKAYDREALEQLFDE